MSPEAELNARSRRYTIVMGIRTLCFILVVALPIPLIWKAPGILAAIVLPYIAVTAANVGVQRPAGEPVAYSEKHTPDAPPAPLEGHKIIDG